MAQITIPEPPLSYEELKAILVNELKKTDEGYCCTIRGLARLLGISVSTLVDPRLQKSGIPMGVLRRLTECSVEELPDSLKPIAGFDYRHHATDSKPNTETYLLPEVVISCVVKYYSLHSRKRCERAKQLDGMFSSIGVRALFEQVLSIKDELPPLVESQLEMEATPVYVMPAPNPLQDMLQLIQRLESYRLRREDIIYMFETIGLIPSACDRNMSYRGVAKHRDKWKAQISINGVTRIIGTYADPEEAARAYDAHAKVIYGEKAKLNFS